MYIGIGYGNIATRGTAEEISLAKKLPMPNAVAATSTLNIFAFEAIIKTYAPIIPNRHSKKKTGNQIDYGLSKPYDSIRIPPSAAKQ